MKNMIYLVEAPPVLCIRSNNRARVLRVDAVCYLIDEAEVSVTLAVVHTGEEVLYARTASRIAKSFSALAAIGHCRTAAIHKSPGIEFSCRAEVSKTFWRRL